MKPLKLLTLTAACALIAAHRLAAQVARDTTPSRAVDTSRVVWGYGSQRKDAVAGAALSINVDSANVGVITNPTHLLTARLPGVSVTLNNGEPGAGAQIRIRGGSSIGASNDPLYVIDGMPVQNTESEARGYGVGGSPALGRNPLNAINPSDIASVTILRDAGATAIYGSRGANGVVLIETKRGHAGQASIEYETYAAFGQSARSLGFLTGDEYRAFVNRQVAAGRLPGSRATSLGLANTDWSRETQRMSLSQNHNLSFAGGVQTTTFRASLNFADQQGVVISNGLKRLQVRLNANHEALTGKLRVGVNLSSTRLENNYLPYDNTGGFEGGVFQNVAIFNPTRPVYVTDGTTRALQFYELGTGRQSVRNPVALADQIRDDGTTTRTLANITATYAIVPSVVAQLHVGSDRSNGQRRLYLPRVSPVGAEFTGLGLQAERALANQDVQAMLTWSPRVGRDIDLDVMGGYEHTNLHNTDIAAQTRNFTTDAFGYNNLGAGSQPQVPTSSDETSALTSFFTRVSVGYLHRYAVTGVMRRDESTLFGVTQKAATFPALSASWLISDESYAKGLPFSQLRLRVGYGLQGNQALDAFRTLSVAAPDARARDPFVSAALAHTASRIGTIATLTGERTAQSNVALDYGFHDGAVSGSLAYYRRKSTDLLLVVPLSRTGAIGGAQLQNIGALQHTGFEFSLDTRLSDRPRDGLRISTGIVFSMERNTVLDLGPTADFIETSGVSGQGQSGVNAQRIIPGQPLGTFFGWRFAGFDANGVQTFTKYTVTRNAQFVETSRVATGVTTNPGSDDKVVIGNANPTFSFGIRSNAGWKRVDVSWLWRVEQGGDLFNNTALAYSTKSNVLQDKNFLRAALSTGESITEPSIYSSRYIESGSFVRLQNVTIGYNFRLSARPIRAYIAGDNLLLFTKYTGNDPEVFIDAGLASRGVDYLSYPRARTVVTGFRIGF